MDAYLESLVRKDEVVEEVSIAAESEAAAEPAEVVESEPAEVEVEPVVQVEQVEPEQPKEVDKSALIKKEASVVGPAEGETITVKHIRVYKTPDTKQIAKNVAGNIKYLGKIGDFSIIMYMKHGFGLVKGYTLDELK